MAGIFRKFAIMNNISTMLGERFGGHLYQGGYNQYLPLNPKSVPIIGYGLPGTHYGLVANHMTWNQNFVENNLPPDTKKITILRNPVSLFESSWKYYYNTFDHEQGTY